MGTFLLVVVISVALFIIAGIKVVNQYERGVILTLGRFTGVREPGLRIVIPIFQRIILVDIRSTPPTTSMLLVNLLRQPCVT